MIAFFWESAGDDEDCAVRNRTLDLSIVLPCLRGLGVFAIAKAIDHGRESQEEFASPPDRRLFM